MAAPCKRLGSLSSTLAVLWTQQRCAERRHLRQQGVQGVGQVLLGQRRIVVDHLHQEILRGLGKRPHGSAGPGGVGFGRAGNPSDRRLQVHGGRLVHIQHVLHGAGNALALA